LNCLSNVNGGPCGSTGACTCTPIIN
jgi:hypothetical protein